MIRSYRTNLLARPPCGVRPYEDAWTAFIVDPIEQLQSLADLLHRGLLSAEEYDRQKAKIIDVEG
jgi:hypothetical protein